jgi:hypothetical protein
VEVLRLLLEAFLVALEREVELFGFESALAVLDLFSLPARRDAEVARLIEASQAEVDFRLFAAPLVLLAPVAEVRRWVGAVRPEVDFLRPAEPFVFERVESPEAAPSKAPDTAPVKAPVTARLKNPPVLLASRLPVPTGRCPPFVDFDFFLAMCVSCSQ